MVEGPKERGCIIAPQLAFVWAFGDRRKRGPSTLPKCSAPRQESTQVRDQGTASDKERVLDWQTLIPFLWAITKRL